MRRLIIILLVALFVVCASLPTRAQDADRIFANGFEEDAAGGGEISCTDPSVVPAGFALKSKTWTDAFSMPGTSSNVFPNSAGTPVPVPGYEWFRRYQQGQYQFYTKGQFISIGFVMEANLDISMTWDTAQSGPNYGTPRPADSMFIGISPCPWDQRVFAGCTRISGLDSLFGSSKPGVNPAFVCPLLAGVTYYLNVLMHDPLNDFAHTCSTSAANSANGCDVQMRHTGTYGVLRWQRTDGWRN